MPNKVFRSVSILAVILGQGVSINSLAHQNHQHHPEASKPDHSEKEKSALEKINSLYQKNIKSIFEKKCMDCHSSKTKYPFYSNWPIAKGLIEKDISEAKKHINMDKDFPFEGHGSPTADLEAIEKAVNEGSMPPRRYRFLHWGSALSGDDKKLIINWIKESTEILKQINLDERK